MALVWVPGSYEHCMENVLRYLPDAVYAKVVDDYGLSLGRRNVAYITSTLSHHARFI